MPVMNDSYFIPCQSVPSLLGCQAPFEIFIPPIPPSTHLSTGPYPVHLVFIRQEKNQQSISLILNIWSLQTRRNTFKFSNRSRRLWFCDFGKRYSKCCIWIGQQDPASLTLINWDEQFTQSRSKMRNRSNENYPDQSCPLYQNSLILKFPTELVNFTLSCTWSANSVPSCVLQWCTPCYCALSLKCTDAKTFKDHSCTVWAIHLNVFCFRNSSSLLACTK